MPFNGPMKKRSNGKRRPKVCFFCVDKIEHVDYKDVERLKKYVSERGKIIPRRVTGNCVNNVFLRERGASISFPLSFFTRFARKRLLSARRKES